MKIDNQDFTIYYSKVLEENQYTNVSIYLNSGNVILEKRIYAKELCKKFSVVS